jgi:predicted NBD/HSP70 family sugar kinase
VTADNRGSADFGSESLARVVQLVRSGTAVTRLDLITKTGLGRAVVRQRVDLAIELGLLEESGIGSSTGGRTPRLLRFRAEAGLLVLAAVGTEGITIGIADAQGAVLAAQSFAWDIAKGPASTLKRIEREVRPLLAALPPAPVWGVGIGLPGPVEFASGRPVMPPIMPGWDGADVRGAFEATFGAPVWVDNDVNVLALGARDRLSSVEGQNLMYVKVGSGIGAGLVSNGRIHRGADGAAGDFGHVAVPGSTVPCRCGQLGCLEAMAGGWALVRDARLAVAEGRSPFLRQMVERDGDIQLEDISAAVAAGDAYSVAAVEAAARTLGEALASFVSIFNPSLIVIGGGSLPLGGSFLARVRESIYRRSLPLATRNLRVVSQAADGLEAVRGVGTLVTQQIFGELLADWVVDADPVSAILAGQRALAS